MVDTSGHLQLDLWKQPMALITVHAPPQQANNLFPLWVVTTTVSQVCTVPHGELLCMQMMYFGMERGVMQMRLHVATLQTSLGSVRSFMNQPLMTWRCASALINTYQSNHGYSFFRSQHKANVTLRAQHLVQSV